MRETIDVQNHLKTRKVHFTVSLPEPLVLLIWQKSGNVGVELIWNAGRVSIKDGEIFVFYVFCG